MPDLKINAATLVEQARARITELSAEELMAHGNDDKLVIIDIRDIRERQRSGFIPNSHHAPRGMLEFWIDPQSPYFKPLFGQEDADYVFYCASGWRSALAVAALQDMGFACAHITDGFTSWVDAGGSVAMPEPKEGR